MSTAIIEPSANSCSTNGVASPAPSLQESKDIKFFALKNLSSHDVEEVDPRSLPKIEYPPNKAAFRDWCNDVRTTHVFFNHTEGLVPSLRITESNPAKYLWGVTADFDATLSALEVAEGVAKRAAPGLLPRFSSVSYSGHARLTWEFEAPVFVDNAELVERFMKLLGKELKWNILLPGLDNSSYKLGQYYEAGRNWTEFSGSKPIPSDLLGLLFFRAAGQQKLTAEGPAIPIEAVAEEVEKRWPGRIEGQFDVGSRTPLFWIDDGIDRIGAVVGDHGMICFSTRAGKSFITWREILGHKFVREFEASRIGAAAEGTWFDGKLYWRKGENGRWSGRTKEDQIMWLKGQGIRARANQKETASEAEKVLLAIQEARKVDAAVSIALDSREYVQELGCRYLNVSVKKAMRPAQEGSPKDFPWLDEFLQNIFDQKQRDHFFAWWKRFYTTGLAGALEQGQAIILGGEAGRGKTLVSRVIVGSSVGGYADASRYLMGESRFNKECGENALWVVDDSKSCANRAQHRAFTEAIKAQISNPQSPMEAKFRDSVTLSWKGRIIITTNIDPDSLAIIPDLGPTIRDKIMFFRFNDDFHPDFMPNQKLEATIAKELPYFLAWLLKWEVPSYVKSKEPRYGIKSYHDPELERASIMASAAHGLTEALDILRKNYGVIGVAAEKQPKEIEVSATEMLQLLNEIDGLGSAVKYYTPETFGRALQTAIRQGYPPLTSKDTKRGTLYTLKIGDKVDGSKNGA